MSDDLRLQAVEALLCEWHNGTRWKDEMSTHYVNGQREVATRALNAALAVMGRSETPDPPFPAWGPEKDDLLLAIGATVSGMAMNYGTMLEIRWSNGDRELKSGATAVTMLDDKLKAAFPDPAREGSP